MEHILTSKVRVEMLNLSFYSTMKITVNKDVFFFTFSYCYRSQVTLRDIVYSQIEVTELVYQFRY